MELNFYDSTPKKLDTITFDLYASTHTADTIMLKAPVDTALYN